MALLRVKWKEACKCQSNPSSTGELHASTTKTCMDGQEESRHHCLGSEVLNDFFLLTGIGRIALRQSTCNEHKYEILPLVDLIPPTRSIKNQ